MKATTRFFTAFRRCPPAVRAQGQAAFTMVEIALALAVIGFALVAIIGILPAGMNVQKENREDTIINQDATFLMEAIRSGSRGADDLTNYVFAITNHWTEYSASSNLIASGSDGYDFNGSDVTSITLHPFLPLTNGFRIIGLLSTPQIVNLPAPPGGFRSNSVFALVRALSGSAVDKYPQGNETILEGAFSYKLTVEVVPHNAPDISAMARTLGANLHQVRLAFRWPLLPNRNTGSGRQTFRTQVSGSLINDPPGSPYFFLKPGVYGQQP